MTIVDELARYTHTRAADWFVLARARDGLRLVGEAVADVRGPGDVVTQAFTCVSAVTPFIATGHTPIYGDIDPDTYALDPARLPLTPRTRAVVAQHTFGMIGEETAALAERAHRAGAILIEDSAHCVARLGRRDGQPVADVSVHSFGAEKILPTSFGGALWVNPDIEDQNLRHAIIARARRLQALSGREKVAAASYRWQLRVYSRTGSWGQRLQDRASHAGLFWPPVTAGETAGESAPARAASRSMTRAVSRALVELPANLAHRRDVARRALEVLGSSVEIPALARSGQPLTRLPLAIPHESGLSGEEAFASLSAGGIRIGKWYRPSLFPGVADPRYYNLDPDLTDLPETRRLTAQVLNLMLRGSADEVCAAARAVRDLVERGR
ncbi:DegT/DnrJ/EryC1/StrS family aminotransferase [Nanchangia anserum]|uniref:DegT/DnrJ/EryC1/StrS family aminotransferase n=1 Tax=Nanchangia anserum TaxID=2692125 RepID=A0A8I0KVA8_9ACTO|nr:DegT/DnrJ/EryC1/StrS family aminotransferase [Nanchangia anserum]MBD3688734.1 DegT/DnrJ/EryC1/StrS family aminotransferase [Nanchangia anserum]QOX82477.1 DegT/DnrJ/EryC1/StrS family aminotransferase [Nanchangia anserum]